MGETVSTSGSSFYKQLSVLNSGLLALCRRISSHCETIDNAQLSHRPVNCTLDHCEIFHVACFIEMEVIDENTLCGVDTEDEEQGDVGKAF